MLNRFAAVFGASLFALPAAAHVTLDQSTMPADSYLRVAIRVPHGCDGAATTGIRLQIPEGFRNGSRCPWPAGP